MKVIYIMLLLGFFIKKILIFYRLINSNYTTVTKGGIFIIKNVIIFGCGNNGIQVLNKLFPNSVAYFCDNNYDHVGKTLMGIEVISFNKLKQIYNDYDIIVSPSNNEEICLQLMENGIPYYLDTFSESGYFYQSDIIKKQDEFLFDRYNYDYSAMSTVFELDVQNTNWFRVDYYDETNKKLIDAMKNNDQELTKMILQQHYSQITTTHKDCLFENRPAMRLIANILHCDRSDRYSKSICDFGCGRGVLLSKLADSGFKCIGVDSYQDVSDDRIEFVMGNVNNSPFADNSFDYVTCLECLEHVENPIDVIKEIYRILKPNGTAIVTVPLGKACDCSSHVRQFDISLIYSLFKKLNFEILNIIKIPYVNNNLNNNIFLVAKKKVV